MKISLPKTFSKKVKFFLLMIITMAIIGLGLIIRSKINRVEPVEQSKTFEPIAAIKPVEPTLTSKDENKSIAGVQEETEKKSVESNSVPNKRPIQTTAEETEPASDVVYDDSMLGLVNKARRASGLGSVRYNSKLNQAALNKAKDMESQNYFSHTNSQGKSDFSFVAAVGYKYQWIGSNIAKGTFSSDQAVFNAWMNSPEHKANILGSKGLEIGYAQCGQYFSFFIAASQ